MRKAFCFAFFEAQIAIPALKTCMLSNNPDTDGFN